jgi:hypothetical protein
MLKSLMLVSASVFALMLIAPAGSHIGPDRAFAIGAGAGGATGGVGGAAGAAAGAAGGAAGGAGGAAAGAAGGAAGAAGAAGGAAAGAAGANSGAAGGLGGAGGGTSGGSTGASPAAGAAAASAAKGAPSVAAGGGSDAKDNSSLAAFMASPVFAHVGPAVPSTVTAGTVYIARNGLPCQAMTQTIDIGGQTVQAKAVLCQDSDGVWRIEPMQGVSTNSASGKNAGAVVE